MKVIEPGHIYELEQLDAPVDCEPQIIEFVNREPGTEHPGTQTQELLRVQIDVLNVLIDRTNHCDGCIRWEGNDKIIKALSEAQRQLRLAIIYHEQRALERKQHKGVFNIENLPVGGDGHILNIPTGGCLHLRVTRDHICMGCGAYIKP